VLEDPCGVCPIVAEVESRFRGQVVRILAQARAFKNKSYLGILAERVFAVANQPCRPIDVLAAKVNREAIFVPATDDPDMAVPS
jgi:hypothetical protein